MNIYNNISSYQRTLNYSQEQISNKNKQSSVKIDFQNVKYTQTSTDQVNLSKRTRGIGSLSLDKGTAANTTLYVDKNTFNNIVSYSTNNASYKWDELGVDGEINLSLNSQTFESIKIKNLLNNEKVMTMLKDIASLNSETISLWQ